MVSEDTIGKVLEARRLIQLGNEYEKLLPVAKDLGDIVQIQREEIERLREILIEMTGSPDGRCLDVTKVPRGYLRCVLPAGHGTPEKPQMCQIIIGGEVLKAPPAVDAEEGRVSRGTAR